MLPDLRFCLLQWRSLSIDWLQGGEVRDWKLLVCHDSTLPEGADNGGDDWVLLTGGQVEKCARKMVSGACRGEAYVKHVSWYDIFLLYRVLIPDVLGWTFRLIFTTGGTRMPPSPLDASPPQKLLLGPQPMAE